MMDFLRILVDSSTSSTEVTNSSEEVVTGTDYLSQLWQSVQNFFSTDNLVKYSIITLFSIIIIIVAHFVVKAINMGIMKSMSGSEKYNQKLIKKGKKPRAPVNYSVIYFIQSMTKSVVYVLVFFLILAMYGVDFTGLGTILAGAVAGISLSLQDVISSFAYGIIILSAKEYSIGDYIVIPDGPEGFVVQINMLNTIIASVDGRDIYIPNNVIGKGVVSNNTTHDVRRIAIDFQMPTDTDFEKIKSLVLKRTQEEEKVLENPAPALVITGFNQDSMTLSLRAYCKNPDYWDLLFKLDENIYSDLRKNNMNVGRGTIKISVADKDEIKGSLSNDSNLSKEG